MQEIRQWLGAPPQKAPETRSKRHVPTGRPQGKRHGKPVAKWDYINLDGEVLVTVYRFEPSGKKKYFQPWDVVQGKVGWPNAPRVLYNLPAIPNHQHIIFVEGEKCAQALIELGYCATTSMSGANAKLEKNDWTPLADKNVLIWPDNDEPGVNFAKKVASFIAKAGASKVEILKPPEGKPDKWDAADAKEEDFDIAGFLRKGERLITKDQPAHHTGLSVFSFGQFLDDTRPMPDDLIAPRVLTPGGLMVFFGAPKVGKTDFLLSLLAHMSGGIEFLGLKPKAPLKVFYLQAEVQYHYLRERLQQLDLPDEVYAQLRDNLLITPQIRITLNEQGVNEIIHTIKQHFKDAPPDVIAIDPIRNVFDGGEHTGGENDNDAMMFFLQERVEAIRRMVNPRLGIILTHHTKKISKKQIEEDPFQSFSGAGSLRSYYTTGAILFRPNENNTSRKLMFELRNGPGFPHKTVDKENGRWIELTNDPDRLLMRQHGAKLDAERNRRHDIILNLVFTEGAKGFVYTAKQFAEKFEGRGGLGGERSIRERINVLATQGYIRFFRAVPEYKIAGARGTRQGYLCVEGMTFQLDTQPLHPSHFKCPHTGDILPAELSPDWPTLDTEENAC